MGIPIDTRRLFIPGGARIPIAGQWRSIYLRSSSADVLRASFDGEGEGRFPVGCRVIDDTGKGFHKAFVFNPSTVAVVAEVWCASATVEDSSFIVQGASRRSFSWVARAWGNHTANPDPNNTGHAFIRAGATQLRLTRVQLAGPIITGAATEINLHPLLRIYASGSIVRDILNNTPNNQLSGNFGFYNDGTPVDFQGFTNVAGSGVGRLRVMEPLGISAAAIERIYDMPFATYGPLPTEPRQRELSFDQAIVIPPFCVAVLTDGVANFLNIPASFSDSYRILFMIVPE